MGILHNNIFKLKNIKNIIIQSNTNLNFLREKVTKLNYYIEEEIQVKEKVTKIKNKKAENKVTRKQNTKEKKIRKMYEDLVWKKNIGPKPDKSEKELVVNRLKYQTPKQQCRYMGSGEAIRKMYEKARYSGQEVTGNDVRAMKEICMLEGKSR